jgi:hypothetical protein
LFIFVKRLAMINDVRNTVLSIISKDNRGYITPDEFNLFAKQAQLEIFEQYIYSYSNSINKQNARMFGEGYTDVPKNLGEVIDEFSVLVSLSYSAPYFLPPANYYYLERVMYNNNIEVEKVSQRKISALLNSNLTAPDVSYPVYTLQETGVIVYPTTIVNNITTQYIRYPKDPVWSYTNISAGQPVFNASAFNYQDFELPLSDFANLVVKILQYAGLSIREAEVVSAAKSEEIQDSQQKQ